MTYLFFCSSKILFHMNVSVLKKKSLSFILFMPFFFFFFGWEMLFIFCVPLCSTPSAEISSCVCVKVFCNNIKRRYGRFNNNNNINKRLLFTVSLSLRPFPSCHAAAPAWLMAAVGFPAARVDISGRRLMGCSTAVTPGQGEHSPHCSLLSASPNTW